MEPTAAAMMTGRSMVQDLGRNPSVIVATIAISGSYSSTWLQNDIWIYILFVFKWCFSFQAIYVVSTNNISAPVNGSMANAVASNGSGRDNIVFTMSIAGMTLKTLSTEY